LELALAVLTLVTQYDAMLESIRPGT